MERQNQHPIPIPGAVPPVMPRQLPPEEYEAAKEKGREWSRIVAQKRSKEFTTEQVEERKLKNRCNTVPPHPRPHMFEGFFACSLVA